MLHFFFTINFLNYTTIKHYQLYTQHYILYTICITIYEHINPTILFKLLYKFETQHGYDFSDNFF